MISIKSGIYSSYSLLLLLLLSACQTLDPRFESPSVTVESLKALPASGFSQPFEVGLKVVNPNAQELKLSGISYQLSIEGHKLAEGASNQVPAVPAFGEASFTIKVSTNLLGGIKLLNDLLNNPRDAVRYELRAKLGTGLPLLPGITVVESGEFNFTAVQKP